MNYRMIQLKINLIPNSFTGNILTTRCECELFDFFSFSNPFAIRFVNYFLHCRQ